MFERFSDGARQAVAYAQENARRLGHGYIGTEHLLLGLLDQPQALAGRLLAEHGLAKADAERTVLALAGDGEEELDAEALTSIGIDLTAVRDRVEATFGAGALDRSARRRGRRADKPVTGHIPFTRRAKKSLELALRAAERLHHPYIGDGHLLLGLLDEGGGLAFRVIDGADIDVTRLRAELDAQIPKDVPA